jgi:hypothetical protein
MQFGSPVLSANVLLCESVTQDRGLQTANRIVDIFTFSLAQPLIRFKALTLLTGDPADYRQHAVQLEMRGYGTIPASTSPLQFYFAHAFDPAAPGGYQLTTNFEFGRSILPGLGTFSVVVLVDSVEVARTPITLRAG